MLSRPREMVLHNRLFIFIGFVIISLATGWAGEEPVNKDRTVRYPDKERLEHYRLDRQFQYKEVNIQEISLFRSLLYWVEQKLIDLFSFEGSGTVYSYIILTGFILIVLYIILKMILPESPGLFLRNRYIRRQKLIREENAQKGSDLTAMIADARIKRNYQLVIYILFVNILQQLHRSNIIRFRPDKTNRDYLKEVIGHKISEKFKEVVLIHEWVRYGNLTSDEKTMLGYINRIDAFYRELNEK